MATACSDEESRISCPICWEPYRRPQSLKCGHVFCSTCIEKILQQNDDGLIQCSTCRRVSEKSDLRRDYKLEEIADCFIQKQTSKVVSDEEHLMTVKKPTGNILCEVCEEQPFTCKCKECNQIFCDACAKSHSRFNMSRDHDILKMAEIKHPVKVSIENMLIQYAALKQRLVSNNREHTLSKTSIRQQISKGTYEIDQFLSKVKTKCETMKNTLQSIQASEFVKVQEREDKNEEVIKVITDNIALLSDILKNDDDATLCSPNLSDEMASYMAATAKRVAQLQATPIHSAGYEVKVSIPDDLDALVSQLDVSFRHAATPVPVPPPLESWLQTQIPAQQKLPKVEQVPPASSRKKGEEWSSSPIPASSQKKGEEWPSSLPPASSRKKGEEWSSSPIPASSQKKGEEWPSSPPPASSRKKGEEWSSSPIPASSQKKGEEWPSSLPPASSRKKGEEWSSSPIPASSQKKGEETPSSPIPASSRKKGEEWPSSQPPATSRKKADEWSLSPIPAPSRMKGEEWSSFPIRASLRK